MKKLFFCAIPLLLLFMACGGSPAPVNTANTDGMTLDQAIAEATVRIEERLGAGTKIAPINFNSPSDKFSAYVLDELTANLVDNGKLIVVDRTEVDLIRNELGFQYSGEVGDDSMQNVGRMLGAQSIISGSLTDMGGFYRIMIRVLNVQNASVEVQYRTNIINDNVVSALLPGGRTTAIASASSGGKTTQTQTQQTVQAPSQAAAPTTAKSSSVLVQGATLTDKLQWIESNAANNTEYRIEVTGNESLSAPILSYPRRRNVTVRLISSGGERILSLAGNGSIFTVESDVTLILDNGITLQGRNQNSAPLVTINNKGILFMNTGAKIVGNTSNNYSGGVYVNENGIFNMTGGEISNNTSSAYVGGGGVYVAGNGNFIMTGGEIHGNRTSGDYAGGGVFITANGRFDMRGGEISNNTANSGGGVHISAQNLGATFTMTGGEIYGNSASGNGGGVYIWDGTFTMTGGEISGNTARQNGGGVYWIGNRGVFTKTGGSIYGSTGANNDNKAGNGHAVFVFDGGLRNSTTGPGVKLDSSKSGAAGGWEN